MKNHNTRIPIILLKTRSAPTDAYGDYFETLQFDIDDPTHRNFSLIEEEEQHARTNKLTTHIEKNRVCVTRARENEEARDLRRGEGRIADGEEIKEKDEKAGEHAERAQVAFAPINVPVLEHAFRPESMQRVERLLCEGQFDMGHGHHDADHDDGHNDGQISLAKRRYGGIIFTSQRAVEAFIDVLNTVVSRYSFPLFSLYTFHSDVLLISFHHKPVSMSIWIIKFRQEYKLARQYILYRLIRILEFFKLLVTGRISPDFPGSMPFYVVGPATQRALLSSPHVPALNVHGAETGNGEKLARFISRHYLDHDLRHGCSHDGEAPQSNRESALFGGSLDRQMLPKNRQSEGRTPLPPPPLLFLVGEQRRDIISRTLRSDDRLPHEKIVVDELVMYEARLSPTFVDDLTRAIDDAFCDTTIQIDSEPRTRESETKMGTMNTRVSEERNEMTKTLWIVIFSPTGCRELLGFFGLLGNETSQGNGCETIDIHSETVKTSRANLAAREREDGEAHQEKNNHQEEKVERRIQWRGIEIYIATIGPTTKDFLIRSFGFIPHVCAQTPTPQGVADGIRRFTQGRDPYAYG